MRPWIWKSVAAVAVIVLIGGAYQIITYNRSASEVKEPDVVIVGTELEGLYLAQKAKAEGLTPLILEPTGHVGGQLLQGEMLYLDGIYNEEGKPLMQGGFKELFHEYTEGRIRKWSQFERYTAKLLEQIPVIQNAVIEEVKVENGRVASITYSSKGGPARTVSPSYVVDNTDNAALVQKLNVQPLPGLEALYGAGQKEYMSATYMMKFKGVDWERFYREFWNMDKMERNARYGPETYVDGNLAYGFPPIVAKYQLRNPSQLNLRGLNILNQQDGEIIINALQVYDVDPNRPETVDKAMQAAREEMPFITEHLKKHLVGFEHLEPAGEPKYLYIREYNHYPTEYVMQASDLLSGRMFWDNVSIGGYFLDIQGSKSNREGLAIGRPDQYGLPLRSYMLKDYNNVFVLGKLVGSTAVAYGSTRIQANGSLAAESIGVLMGMYKGRDLHGLSELEMASFHQYMNSKYGISLHQPEGRNKIASLGQEELAELNQGLITLLPHEVQARHLPFIRVYYGQEQIGYKGIKPVIIDGSAWVPLEETFRVLGAMEVRYDAERKQVFYSLQDEPAKTKSLMTPVHVLNNHALIHLQTVAGTFDCSVDWDPQQYAIRIKKKG